MEILGAIGALSPVLVCAILIAIFKRTAVVGAATGIVLAILLTLYHNIAFFNLANLSSGFSSIF